MNTRNVGFHVGLICAIAVVAAILTYPLILHLHTHIPYHKYLEPSAGDHWVFLWAFGFIKRMLVEMKQWPFFTDALFYPRGVDLTYPLLFGVGLPLVISIPFVHVLGVVATYNVFIVGAFVATAYTTWLLVRYLTHDSRAAFVAGIIFAFCPYHMTRAVGHFNLATSGMWIPLYVLFLLRAVRDKSIIDLIVTPLVLALTFAWNPYNAIFLGFFTAIYMIYHIVSYRNLSLNRLFWRRLCLVGGLGVLLFFPLVWLLLTYGEKEAQLSIPLTESARWGADLLAFFVPSTHHVLWGDWVRPLYVQLYTGFAGNDTEQTVYIGYTVLALAVVAIMKAPKAETRLWLLSAIIFFILSLGPFLHIYGSDSFALGGIELSVPLPNYLLHFIPGFSAVRGWSRFSVMLMFAMAVLAGYGTRRLLQRLEGSAGAALLCLLLIVAITGEFLIAPLRLVDARIPKIYERIAKEGEKGGTLLDVPLHWSLSQYEYYQIAHQKRLLLGYLPRLSTSLFASYADSVPFVRLFKDPNLIQDYDQTPVDQRDVRRFIEFFDLSWIVFHKDHMWPEIFERLRRFVLVNFPIAHAEEEGDIVALRLARDAYNVAELAEPKGYIVDFGETAPQFFIADGWSYPEQWGELTVAWSNAKESRVWVFFSQVEDSIMELRLLPVKLPAHPPQTVKIYVNERFLGEIELDASGWRSYTLPLPGMSLLPGINTFRFAYRYTKSPSNEDSRRLGVAFDFVKFHPE